MIVGYKLLELNLLLLYYVSLVLQKVLFISKITPSKKSFYRNPTFKVWFWLTEIYNFFEEIKEIYYLLIFKLNFQLFLYLQYFK